MLSWRNYIYIWFNLFQTQFKETVLPRGYISNKIEDLNPKGKESKPLRQYSTNIIDSRSQQSFNALAEIIKKLKYLNISERFDEQ